MGCLRSKRIISSSRDWLAKKVCSGLVTNAVTGLVAYFSRDITSEYSSTERLWCDAGFVVASGVVVETCQCLRWSRFFCRPCSNALVAASVETGKGEKADEAVWFG